MNRKFLALLILLVFSVIPFFSNAQKVEASDPWHVTQEVNQLINADFEKPLIEEAIPGWTILPKPLGDGTSVAHTDEKSYTGQYSVRFDDNSTSSPIALVSSNLPTHPGRSYTASTKTFITTGSPIIYIKFFDNSGKIVGEVSQGMKDPKNSWTTLSVEGIAPENATTAQIWLYSGVGTVGTIYFDHVTFEEKAILTLPYEYGKAVSLGDATLVAQTQGGAIGNGEIYFGVNGSPSVFYAVEAFSGEVKFSQQMPGDNVVWAVTIGSDGNAYVAGTGSRNLYRYRSGEKTLESVGLNPSNKHVWDLDASSDGKIYGSTYPDSKAFVYDIQADTFTDLGTLKPGQDYVRGSGVTDQYFYAGIGTTAHLLRFNRITGEEYEVMIPVTGTEAFVSDIWSYGGRLFIRIGGTSLLILNEETEEILMELDWEGDDTFDGVISPPSPYEPNLIYFRNNRTSELWVYDMDQNGISAVTPQIKLPETPLRAIEWVELQEGPNAGRQVLVMLTHDVERLIYDPIDHTVTSKQLDVARIGLNVQSLEKGPDDNLYMGGYQGGMSVYDAKEGEFLLQEKEPDQIEGIGFLNGTVYFGIYGGSLISAFDPTQPFDMGVNPYTAYSIPDNQSRPFTFATGEGKLFSGTSPHYGHLGGSLVIYDSATDEWNSYRHVVQNQSIIGLAYDDGKVYGGTTIWGGLGVEPTETEAKIFVWDVDTSQKIEEFVPNVPGMPTPTMIGELEIGPDGNLWGIMWGNTSDNHEAPAIFVMDMETKQILKSKIMDTGDKGAHQRPFHMRWGEDGLLYTTIGRQVIVFDPDTLASRLLVNQSAHVNSMTLGPDGSIYYSHRAELMKIPVRMEGASMTVPKTSMAVGEELELKVNLQLVNGKTGNTAGAEVDYHISDPSVVEIRDGKLYALESGTVTISATVTQDIAVETTNHLQIEVYDIPQNTSTMLDTLNKNQVEFNSEAAYRSLKIHLTSILQFEKQEEVAKVVQHMESFIILLNHQKTNEMISDRLYDILITGAELIISQ